MPLRSRQLLGHVLGRQLFAVHPLDVHLGLVLGAAVLQGFLDALVGVLQLHVLAHQADVDLVLGLLVAVQEVLPAAQVGIRVVVDAQLAQHHLIQVLILHQQGHVVDGLGVAAFDHRVGVHVAEQGDLLLHALLHGVLGAAHQHIGLHAQAQQFLHAVLRGLGLQFAGGAQVGQKGQVDGEAVLALGPLQLADGLHVGQALDVAHGAAHLGDHEVVDALAAQRLDVRLDLVGDVRDHLHGLAEVFAAALLADDVLVDAAGGDVVGLAGGHVQEALVVAQVQVGLGAVLGHEALAVLVGVQRAGVHVDVGVQLLDGDREAARLQQLGQAGTDDALAQGGGHAPGNENVLGGSRHHAAILP